MQPLKKYGYITSYKKESGLNGPKYSIYKPEKKNTILSKNVNANNITS